MIVYILGLGAMVIFSSTGVLGAVRKDRDVLGLMILGVITAVGGGTMRDVILGVPVFWVQDMNYVIVSCVSSIALFFLLKIASIKAARYKLLLYFDAIGMAYFCIQAFDKTTGLGHGFSVALVMALLTGMGGGVMRDVLSGRPNLLITRELYASPALLGSLLYGIFNSLYPGTQWPKFASMAFIALFRIAAVYFNLQMPLWLVNRRDPD